MLIRIESLLIDQQQDIKETAQIEETNRRNRLRGGKLKFSVC